MSIINRTCLLSSGAEFHLPPFGDGSPVAAVTEMREVSSKTIPYGGVVEAYNQRHGWEISCSGIYIGTTREAGQAWIDSLRDALVDDDGIARTVEIATWSDSASALKRIYRSCTLQGGIEYEETHSMRVGYSFVLRSKDPARYATFSTGAVPGAGPYESYLYQGNTGVTPAVPLALTVPIPVFFSGVLEITTANNVGSMQATLRVPTGCAYIKSIYIAAATMGDADDSGNTLIDVSTTDYSSAGTSLRATLAHNATATTATAGNVAVTAGDSVYVYVAGVDGGHSNVTVIVTFGS